VRAIDAAKPRRHCGRDEMFDGAMLGRLDGPPRDRPGEPPAARWTRLNAGAWRIQLTRPARDRPGEPPAA
jgi:hypothetical protein